MKWKLIRGGRNACRSFLFGNHPIKQRKTRQKRQSPTHLPEALSPFLGVRRKIVRKQRFVYRDLNYIALIAYGAILPNVYKSAWEGSSAFLPACLEPTTFSTILPLSTYLVKTSYPPLHPSRLSKRADQRDGRHHDVGCRLPRGLSPR